MRKIKKMKSVEIFTDGACRGNPGKGGWGALLRYNKIKRELYGYQANTTNNKMELMAAIKALEALNQPCNVILTTDSKYVINGIERWIKGWKKRNWRTSSKTAVKNKTLWQRLDKVTHKHKVKWKWVKGHSGHVENDRVDALANKGIDTKKTHSQLINP